MRSNQRLNGNTFCCNPIENGDGDGFFWKRGVVGNRGVFSSILPLIYLNYCCCYLLSVSYGIFYFEALSGPIVTCLQFCSC